MITILSDHDIEGQARRIWEILVAEGWPDLIPLQFLRFTEVGLSERATDREVWHFVQEQQMFLLTANRNMEDDTSLEQTIRAANTASALPVLTIGSVDRFTDRKYQEACAARLLDIVLYAENHLGTGRIYIP